MQRYKRITVTDNKGEFCLLQKQVINKHQASSLNKSEG